MNSNETLYMKFAQLEWLLKRKQMIEVGNGNFRFDTTKGQGRILATLKMKDGIRTKDLSYILGITIASLNETLAKLEREDLIERKPSKEDKRVMLVWLTEKGYQEISEIPENQEFNFLDCLSETEQKNFEDYIDKIIAHTKEMMGEQSIEFSEQMRKMAEERERIFRETGMFGGMMDNRGAAPEGMPGAERFRPDYKGPFPDGMKEGR